MKICIFGAASPRISDIYVRASEELGRRLAAGGHEMIFGGGACGCMGGAARGAHEAGGKVTGILPEFFREATSEDLFEEDELIYTGDLAERKKAMLDVSDAFIICPGGLGTFDELFEILTQKQLGLHARPIVVLNTGGYFDSILEAVKHAEEEHFMSKTFEELLDVTASPAEAVEICERSVAQPEK